MSRKIIALQSTSVAASTPLTLPVGSCVWYFVGEADGKPTYDFQVACGEWMPDSSTVGYRIIKYCGARNGRKTMLHQDFPEMSTSAAAPNNTGDRNLVVTPGTGVVGQIYYINGTLST